jgi:tetratricopeptide (TPR) repeat protein
MSLNYAGRHQEAIPLMEKAIRLNPLPPAFYYLNLGGAYSRVGRTEEAIAMYKNAIALTPNNVMAYATLAAAYASLDREDEAKAAAAQVLRINPKFSAKRYAYSLAYKDQSISARFMELMIKAGLPE